MWYLFLLRFWVCFCLIVRFWPDPKSCVSRDWTHFKHWRCEKEKSPIFPRPHLSRACGRVQRYFSSQRVTWTIGKPRQGKEICSWHISSLRRAGVSWVQYWGGASDRGHCCSISGGGVFDDGSVQEVSSWGTYPKVVGNHFFHAAQETYCL